MPPDDRDDTIEAFTEKITRYERHVFGLTLYYDTAPWWTRWFGMGSFDRIKEREEQAIEEARELLRRIEDGKADVEELKRFSWPPIPDFAKDRIETLLQVYGMVFPVEAGKPPGERQRLSDDEATKLRNEVAKRL